VNKASLVRFVALLVVLAGLVVAVQFFRVEKTIKDFLTWIQDLGPWGPVALAAIYIVATVLMIPGSLLTLGAGFCFKLVLGFITVSVGSTLGATAAFLVGRTLARGQVEAKLAGNARFRALDQAVGENGFKIVLLTRLSPLIPFNLVNYAFGLTRVCLRDYVLASWVGMIPGTIMYVYFGTLANELTDLGSGAREGETTRLIFYVAGLVVTVVLTIVVTRFARAALAKAIPVPPDQSDR
jgi:uncharacterized membrane protein YdjX (TVP38/TMEM64 family)